MAFAAENALQFVIDDFVLHMLELRATHGRR
jgi:hypothetical protein